MSEDNNNLVRQFVRDIFIHHHTDCIDEMLSHDFTYSSELIKEPKDRQWTQEILQQIFIAFPDFNAKIEAFNSTDDIITLKLLFSGTLRDDFMGIKASGQSFSGYGVMIFKVMDNKIQQIQAKMNTTDFLSQLAQNNAAQ